MQDCQIEVKQWRCLATLVHNLVVPTHVLDICTGAHFTRGRGPYKQNSKMYCVVSALAHYTTHVHAAVVLME